MGEIPKLFHAPNIIIRHRQSEGRINHSVRIDRFWQCQATGNHVEVKKYYNVANEGYMLVVFYDPIVKHELSLREPEFRKQYKSIGNKSSKI